MSVWRYPFCLVCSLAVESFNPQMIVLCQSTGASPPQIHHIWEQERRRYAAMRSPSRWDTVWFNLIRHHQTDQQAIRTVNTHGQIHSITGKLLQHPRPNNPEQPPLSTSASLLLAQYLHFVHYMLTFWCLEFKRIAVKSIIHLLSSCCFCFDRVKQFYEVYVTQSKIDKFHSILF